MTIKNQSPGGGAREATRVCFNVFTRNFNLEVLSSKCVLDAKELAKFMTDIQFNRFQPPIMMSISYNPISKPDHHAKLLFKLV